LMVFTQPEQEMNKAFQQILGCNCCRLASKIPGKSEMATCVIT
jgi:hypothetical protein